MPLSLWWGKVLVLLFLLTISGSQFIPLDGFLHWLTDQHSFKSVHEQLSASSEVLPASKHNFSPSVIHFSHTIQKQHTPQNFASITPIGHSTNQWYEPLCYTKFAQERMRLRLVCLQRCLLSPVQVIFHVYVTTQSQSE